MMIFVYKSSLAKRFFTADGEKVVDMTSQFLLMPRDDFLPIRRLIT